MHKLKLIFNLAKFGRRKVDVIENTEVITLF